MSTIDSPSIIRTILVNDGCYPGDPRLYSVWSYINDWGNPAFKIISHPGNELDFLLSPFIHTPKLLWNSPLGITPAGQAFLDTPETSHDQNSQSAEHSHV